MSSCEGNPRKDLTQPFTCCKYAGVIFRHAGTSTSPLVNSISALESQALGFEQLVGIFNELQTIFINAFFPSFSEGSSNILQIFRSSFSFFFATEEYEFNSGNVFTNSSAILDFCLPPQMQSIMGNWKIENTWLNFALIILWPLRSLMVIKLLASARNSPMAPWSAGLLFSLSVAGEALLDLGSVG